MTTKTLRKIDQKHLIVYPTQKHIYVKIKPFLPRKQKKILPISIPSIFMNYETPYTCMIHYIVIQEFLLVVWVRTLLCICNCMF